MSGAVPGAAHKGRAGPTHGRPRAAVPQPPRRVAAVAALAPAPRATTTAAAMVLPAAYFLLPTPPPPPRRSATATARPKIYPRSALQAGRSCVGTRGGAGPPSSRAGREVGGEGAGPDGGGVCRGVGGEGRGRGPHAQPAEVNFRVARGWPCGGAQATWDGMMRYDPGAARPAPPHLPPSFWG